MKIIRTNIIINIIELSIWQYYIGSTVSTSHVFERSVLTIVL